MDFSSELLFLWRGPLCCCGEHVHWFPNGDILWKPMSILTTLKIWNKSGPCKIPCDKNSGQKLTFSTEF